MRLYYTVILICLAMLCSGCLSIPPHQGGFGLGSYTYAEDGELLNQKPDGLKIGRACIIGDSLLPGIYYNWRGDASVRTAARNGDIKDIKSVARSYKRPLFGSTHICTVVYGD